MIDRIKKGLHRVLEKYVFYNGIKVSVNKIEVLLPFRFRNYFGTSYEPENTDFIKKYAPHSGTIMDIGAHIGLMSIVMAKTSSEKTTIHAFEPTPSTFKILQDVIRMNQSEGKIIAVRQALSNKEGQANFYITDIDAHNSNSLAPVGRTYQNEHTIKVQVSTLDQYIEENHLTDVDLVKIDAEGAEYNVLKGAEHLIKSNRPNIILSLHPTAIHKNGNSLEEIWNFISSYYSVVYYEGRVIDKNSFTEINDLFDVHLIHE